jgi:predicted XRE-type DNA-binding protein
MKKPSGMPVEDHQLKSKIAALIGDVISANGLSQTAAGKRIGVKQQEISLILRGNLDSFSVERLLGYARAFGASVEIKVKPPAKLNAEAGRMSLRIGR